jgi:uncharacterized protein
LFRTAWKATGGVATCLEWDDAIPDFAACVAELHKAKAYMAGQGMGASVVATNDREEQAPHPAAFLVPDAMASIAEGAA